MNSLLRLVKDIRGIKFHHLTVREFIRVENRKSRWLCECDCGNFTEVMGVNLRHTGGTKSCGCLAKSPQSQIGKFRPSGSTAPTGAAYKRLQKIRSGMIARCYDDTQLFYKDYGGRGIKVCQEWLDSFDAFYFWAMTAGYDSKLSIDRKNNDGSYCPDNCRWSTAKEQSHNRRTSRHYKAFGESKVLEEWCRDSRKVVSKNTIKARVKDGWDMETALTTPAMSLKDRAALGHEAYRLKLKDV